MTFFTVRKRVKMSKVSLLVESSKRCDSPTSPCIPKTSNICVPVKRKRIERSTRSPKKSSKLEELKNMHKTNERRPDSSMQYDRIDHLAEIDQNKNSTRCKLSGCKSKTHVFCTKCMIHLCLVGGRNCFRKFHTQTNVNIEVKKN